MKKRIILILILAVLCGVLGYFVWHAFFGEDDQTIIGRRMNEMFQVLGKSGNEGFVVQLEHARTIAKYFDESCDVRLPRFHLETRMSRDDIEKNVIKARNWTTSMELKIYEPVYQFQTGDLLRCKVTFTGMLDAQLRSGGSFQEGYEIEMSWVKKEGEWLVDGIGFSQILNK